MSASRVSFHDRNSAMTSEPTALAGSAIVLPNRVI